MAKSIFRRKKRITIALVAVLTVTGAGAAFAYWTTTGTGNGTATTGTSVAFTIASGQASGTLAPGSAGQTVPFTVTNPGTGPQYLTSVTVQIANADGSTWVPPVGCVGTNYSATISTAPTAGEIAAGGSVSNGVATVTLASTTENQDACKTATVPLYFSAS
ncbi:MAG: hypothetical protein ABWX56_08335 [Mycetocola sp.]